MPIEITSTGGSPHRVETASGEVVSQHAREDKAIERAAQVSRGAGGETVYVRRDLELRVRALDFEACGCPEPVDLEPEPDPTPEPTPSPPSGAALVQAWEFDTTAQMRQGVRRAWESGGGQVSLIHAGTGARTPGGRAMRADYGSVGLGDGRTAGADLTLPSEIGREVWVECWMRFDSAWRPHSDDKTLFLLEDHSASGGPSETSRWDLHFQRLNRWYGGHPANGSFIIVDQWSPAADGGQVPVFADGQWHRLRVHARMESTPGARDAAFRVWWDERLVIASPSSYRSGSPAGARFGVLALGRNADPQGSGIRDWGLVQAWATNPGW